MKTQYYNVLLTALAVIILLPSCNDSIHQPDTDERDLIKDNPTFYHFGLDKSIRKYSFTVSEINMATNKPTYYPHDSVKSSIQYPESLYSKGIFVYGTMEETIDIVGDTMTIRQRDYGHNLFAILNNPGTDGASGGFSQQSFFADSGAVYNLYGLTGQHPSKTLLYKIPFVVGDSYTIYLDTITVTGIVDLQTKAGLFAATEIVKQKYISAEYRLIEKLYIVSNIGICRHELRYIEQKKDPVSGKSYSVEQVQRYELTGYK
ncbi:MAG: hypothetical protein HUU02_10655 [Bacteroidetes bacterium]|nr:hypothetical protein [Bacteroidota bacterium]